MLSMTKIFAKTNRFLIGGVSAVVLSTAMTMGAGAADISTTYTESCAACHDSGALNAIKKGDSAKWQQLIKQKGMPALVSSVKNGMIQMPAGGLCEDCSNDDYRKLIEYMSK